MRQKKKSQKSSVQSPNRKSEKAIASERQIPVLFSELLTDIRNLVPVAVSLITELADRKDIFEHFAKSGISAFLAGKTIISDKQNKKERIKFYTHLAEREFLIAIRELCDLLLKEMEKQPEIKNRMELRKVKVNIK